MISQFGDPVYNPLLFLGDEYNRMLDYKMYEPITYAMMKGLVVLVLANLFTAFVVIRYRCNQETKLTKKFLIALYIVGAIEFYYRGLSYFLDDIPFSESFLQRITAGVFWRTILQGILFITFTVCVWKRAKSETAVQTSSGSPIERELSELMALQDKGVISEEEYSTKRAKILS